MNKWLALVGTAVRGCCRNIMTSYSRLHTTGCVAHTPTSQVRLFDSNESCTFLFWGTQCSAVLTKSHFLKAKFHFFFCNILTLCMVSIQERFIVKSRLWWRTYGSQCLYCLGYITLDSRRTHQIRPIFMLLLGRTFFF